MAKKKDPDTINKIIEMYQTMSSEEISKITGITPRVITKYIKAAGIPIRGNQKITPVQGAEMYELFENGMSTPEIAKKYNIWYTTVHDYVNQERLKEKWLNFTEKDIKQIIEKYLSGDSSDDIAGVYDCCDKSILKILKDNNIEIRPKRTYPVNESYMDNIDCEEKAYMLGFFYADGSNWDNKRISIGLKSDDHYMVEKFCSLFYDEQNSKGRVKKYFRRKYREKTNDWYEGEISILSIYSRKIAEQFTKLGCHPKKTFNMSFPEWLDVKYYNSFILGFFDGDGCITYDESSSTKTKSFKINMVATSVFVSHIKKILDEMCGVNFRIFPHAESGDKGISIISLSGNRVVSRVMKFLYQNSLFYLNRKHERHQTLLKEIDKIDNFALQNKRGYSKSNIGK